MPNPLRIRFFLVLPLLTLIVACTSSSNLSVFPGVHKIDLQQGNIIDQEKLDQLEVGMTRAQAQFVMGTPLVSDTFILDRWDYVFRLLSASGEVTQKTVSLYFEDNILVEIEGKEELAESEPAAEPDTDAS